MRNLRLLLAPILASVLFGSNFAPAVVVGASPLPLTAPALGLASSAHCAVRSTTQRPKDSRRGVPSLMALAMPCSIAFRKRQRVE